MLSLLRIRKFEKDKKRSYEGEKKPKKNKDKDRDREREGKPPKDKRIEDFSKGKR